MPRLASYSMRASSGGSDEHHHNANDPAEGCAVHFCGGGVGLFPYHELFGVPRCRSARRCNR